jgi:adenosylcobinamide amidohydrolase
VPLSDAAYVGAVMTATEAKTQAVLEAGFRATGTATDAICIAAPAAGQPEDFTGPRSLWGARIARAVHSAVHADILDRFQGRVESRLSAHIADSPVRDGEPRRLPQAG